jgi:hypothetical protein
MAALNQLGEMEKAQRRNERVVWLLGAGFSKPLGGPLFSELISERVALWVRCWLASKDVSDEAIHDALNVFKKGEELGLWENAEECITLINEARSDEATRAAILETIEELRNEKGLEDVERQLSRFVAAATAHFVVRALGAEQLPEAWTPYREWAKLLSGRDSIVNFNYDRVVESLFRRTEKRTALVKLHGTVSETLWEDIRDGKPISNIALLGPDKLRSRDEPMVSEAWEQAGTLLEQANRLVVIGYSFPASDAYARWFILSKCRAVTVDVVLGPGEFGEAITGMFARFLGKPAVRNTRLLAQEYLAEGCARPWEDRFNHWLTY